MVKLKGLGKGLDALLSASNIPIDSIIDDDNLKLEGIMLSEIKPGKYQPRRTFDEEKLQELAESIKQNGVIQPIIVRKTRNYYEIIAGERRFRASKIAGLEKIPAVIRNISDKEALAIALIENIQRKDLNIIEESRGYKRLIDEFKLTHEDLAKVTSKSRSHITNILRLLNLKDEVQEMLIKGMIDMGHARALLSLPKDSQLKVANKVILENLTTSDVEKYVASIINNNSNSIISSVKVKTRFIDPNISKLENDLADKIGMMVSIKHGTHGHGKITISYDSLEELDNLLKYLK
ncbi:MAG: ParB/RepB/Spo0J family partition protein [Neisseriaceae bacterium]